MIGLVFDTNILHQEGLASGRMKLLKKLIDIEFVRLYIPELVKKEFISKRIANSTDAMIKSANNLKTTSSNFELSVEFRTDLSTLEDAIRSKINIIEKAVLHEFDNWSRDFRVTELKFNPEDIHSVMSDYFLGHGVYRSVKSREDIPDAMINSCINRLTNDIGNIYVIIKDGAFRKHLESNQSVVVFESLSDFLKAEAVEALKDRVDAVENVRNFLESDAANQSLFSYFKEIDFNKGYIYIDENGISNKEIIADRVYGAEIDTIINKNIRSLRVNNLYALTPQKYVGDLTFVIDSTVHFVSDYGTFLELEKNKERNVVLDSMNGDGMCDLYEPYKVRCFGQIEIAFEHTFDTTVVEVLMRDIKHNEGVVKVDLNVESCELLVDDA